MNNPNPPPRLMDGLSSTTQEDMDLFPESPPASYISFGLNNIVARETRTQIDISNKPQFCDPHWRVESPTSERSKYNPWPVLKKAVSSNLTEGTKVPRKWTENQSSTSLPSSSLQNSNSKLRSFSAKRKISFPELGKGIMAAVHARIDSPTIPGWLPLHERSNSAPGGSARSIPFENSFLAPVSEPYVLFSKSTEDLRVNETTANNDRLNDVGGTTPTAERSSPSNSSEKYSAQGSQNLDGDEEKPPVPPKSPRLAARSAPNQQGRLASKFNASSKKTPLRIDTNITKPEPATNVGHITCQMRQPELRPRAATAMDFYPPEPVTARLHKRSESACDTAPSTQADRLESRRNLIEQKEQAPANVSIMNRGRPKKRHSPERQAAAPKQQQHQQQPASDRISFATIPLGVDLADATSEFTSSDMEKLHNQAKIQAQRFKVLKYDDVKAMSQELRVLDERYDYLRNTHKSLRTGRNRLHQRMMNFLRSPRSATNCRENMLRQEEALAELDRSIDEWITKLEQVEHRRSCVRQKILEHVAASLILSATSPSQAAQLPQQTPPQSPVKDDASSDTARESIKIYADSRVYADADIEDLLADIERQMDDMNQSRDPSPCLNSALTA